MEPEPSADKQRVARRKMDFLATLMVDESALHFPWKLWDATWLERTHDYASGMQFAVSQVFVKLENQT